MSPLFSLPGLFLLIFRLETIKVSAWVPALLNNSPRTTAFPHRRHGMTTIHSAIDDSAETSTETSAATTQQQQITVPMPKIQYTVPGLKLGWREDGVWMDDDGPRSGPPQNYWRQVGDERVYNRNIDLIQDLLKLNSLEANGTGSTTSVSDEEKDTSIIGNDNVNEMVRRLENTNSIRIPSLNRLILGDWAPVVRGGKVIARSTADDEKSADLPYRFHIERTAGRKFAPETVYGTFDEHLKPGEKLTVQELSSSNAVTSSGALEVSSDKLENRLVKGYNNAIDGDLYVGGVTYVTNYIMIMRQQAQQQETEDENQITKGPITEIWMRIES